MAPLVLEGETLGQRRHHYNKLVKAATDDQVTELLPLNYDDPDVDNLLRIDVACSRRNVEYVLDVLQSDDMLYVSRAIKRSTWLITDDRYAHIINPEYLNNELFPKMTSKAKNKLMLAIRLNLKKESRVEEFFHFYSDDINVSQKWLPNCSWATIEKVYKDHSRDITTATFKRLCEKSIEVLKILLNLKNWYYIGDKLAASKILLSKNAKEYLDIVKSFERHDMPSFGTRATKQLMKHCPEEVLKDMKKFSPHIHLPTLAKCLKKEDIPDFLLKQAENKEIRNWIKYDNIKHFAVYLPIATRFEFVKKLFIDKETSSTNQHSQVSEIRVAPRAMMCARSGIESDCAMGFDGFSAPSTNAGIYRWYRFAPFDAAFVDLKKLIRVESSPAERNAMLTILVNCGRRNPAHIKAVLQFYREKHMNEPFKFKVQFVNSLISLVETHKFDVETWGILNDIFTSMEVYLESENSVPYCVKAIIVYKLLHNENIPEIIQKKHTFDTFKEYRKKLEAEDSEKLFTYLYNLQIKKLKKLTLNNEVEMTIASTVQEEVFTLLKDWEKKVIDYPEILENIRNLIKAKKENSFKNDLSYIYKVEKKWQKDLFEESLLLKPDDEACIRALKYDPGLLQRHSGEVSAMRSNDSISLKRTLLRLRIYWAQSLAQKWVEEYLGALPKPTGHKATIEGLCVLLSQKQLLSLLEKYAPDDHKIDWSNTDTAVLSLRKNIAKQMKLIRPSVNLGTILLYAKDDYLQFALPSLNSSLYNMSATQVSKYVRVLFDAPVSLKKHGLRLAYTKLKFSEIKDLVEDIWKNNKNSSIRAVLFKETFKLLRKAKKDSSIQELWQLLNMFIDNLNPDENRVIYDILGEVQECPLQVRHELFVKSYKYLTSLPAKANCEPIIQRLQNHAPEIMDRLEPSFVESFLLKPVPEFVSAMAGQTDDSKRREAYGNISILTSYLIHSDSEAAQYAKYEKYLIPVFGSCFETWSKIEHGEYIVRSNVRRLLRDLLNQFKSRGLNKSETSIKMFKDIETKLRALPIEENYTLVTFWSIVVLFVESLNKYLTEKSKSDVQVDAVSTGDQAGESAQMATCPPYPKVDKEKETKWNELCAAVAPLFGKSLMDFVKLDIASQHLSLATYFADSLIDVLNEVELDNKARLLTSRHMLNSDLAVLPMIVLKVGHRYYDLDEELSNLRREIYNIIKAHPSVEVKIQYHEAMNNDPDNFGEAVPYLR